MNISTFKLMSKDKQLFYLLESVVRRCNGKIEKLPCAGPEPRPQEFLKKEYHGSEKASGSVLVDLRSRKIKKNEPRMDDPGKKQKLNVVGGSVYFTLNGMVYNIHSLDTELPVSFRTCKHSVDGEEKNILIGEISVNEEWTFYFEPDFFYGIFYSKRANDPSPCDMAFLLTYDRTEGICAKNDVVGFPNCETVSELLEFINRLSSVICSNGNGGDNDETV